MSAFSFRSVCFVLSQAGDVEPTQRVLLLVVSVAAAFVLLSGLFIAAQLFRLWL